MKKYNIILDTDIGDDIDDAFALSLALRSPEINILGITTVFKNVYLRSKIAKHMVNLANRADIEVYLGIDKPLKSEIIRWDYETEDHNGKIKIRHYTDEMKDARINQMPAVDFILKTIDENPNGVTIVAIGPLTNLAKAYLKNPNTFLKVKEIIMMAGQLKGTYPEWNIKVDVDAAKIILGLNIPIKMVGLDVTTQCKLDDETIEKFSKLPDLMDKLTYKMLNIWLNDNKKQPTFHDPLTIATMINDCCHFEPYEIKIITNGEDYGKMIAKRVNESSLMAATTVDVSSFMKLLEERFKLT